MSPNCGLICARKPIAALQPSNTRRTEMLLLAPVFGLATLIAAGAALQALIAADAISRYVVPPPSDVLGAFWRIVLEEHVPARFLLTSLETFAAGLLILA